MQQYRQCEPLLAASNDVEAVHKARVAIRKLRSHLHSFEGVLDPAWCATWRTRLRAVQDMLAPVRDADVFSAAIRDAARAIDGDAKARDELFATFDASAAANRRALRDYLQTADYNTLIAGFIEAVQTPVFASTRDGRSKPMRAVMRRALKTTRRCVRSAGALPSDPALHRIRIKAKHLRYAAEAFACDVGRPASRYAKRVERLQEMLGEQHDAVVIQTRLSTFRGSPQAEFLAGELAASAAQRGSRAATHWRRCWRAIRRRRNRFW